MGILDDLWFGPELENVSSPAEIPAEIPPARAEQHASAGDVAGESGAPDDVTGAEGGTGEGGEGAGSGEESVEGSPAPVAAAEAAGAAS